MINQGVTSTSSQMTSSLLMTSVAALVLVLAGHTHAVLPSDSLAYTPKYFQEVSGEPQTPGPGHQKATPGGHLMKLLSVQDSLSELLAPDQADGFPDSPRGDALLGDTDPEDAHARFPALQPPEHKRVFCNGFTGCGGRFRAARRHPGKHGADKRVFCNSRGCMNGGRKRAAPTQRAGLDLDLWRQALRRLEQLQAGRLDQLEGGARSKRLFCNNYGGCHNVGKRRRVQDAQPRRATSAGRPGPAEREEEEEEAARRSSILPKLDFYSDRQQRIQGKRFFSGGFDGDMDELIDSLR